MPLNVLLPIVIGLILLILIIRIFPFLLILFTKATSGKYSEEYIEKYRKHTGEDPYLKCIRGDFVNSITGFYGDSGKIPTFKTEKSITFEPFDFGQNISHLFKLRGTPGFVTAHNLAAFDLKVFGYSDELFNFENRSFFYFADGIFFMGEYSVEVTDDKLIEEISQILQNKYFGSSKTSSHNYLIEGSNKALIYFNSTGFRLSIQYLNKSDAKINELIDKYWKGRIRQTSNISTDIESELTKKL